MNEGQRSAEEREAARLERERERARRGASMSSDVAPPDPESIDATTPFEEDGEVPFDEEEPEDELPLGTRRVANSNRRRIGKDPAERARPRPAPAAVRRRHSRAGRVASLIAIVLGAAIIWFCVELFQPFHGSGHGSVVVTIPARSGARQIGNLLERDGVISSAFFFDLRATLAGKRGDLRPGTYRLRLGMSYGDVLKLLTTPPPAAKVTNVTLIEGLTRRQIDALLRSQHVRGSYLAVTRSSRLLNPQRYGAPRRTPSLEGFLFPSTYQLREPISISTLVADQLRTLTREFATINLGYARSKHLTPYDVLIIASILEKEAGTSHDRPLVASVIYNRLAKRMPLGMDSTTRYEFNDYTKRLTKSQLSARSPYNTRLNAGLPPTPIGNPGLAAIEAAAHPARTNYLYFVVKSCGNGASVFTSSYSQFLVFQKQYQTALAKRGRSPAHC